MSEPTPVEQKTLDTLAADFGRTAAELKAAIDKRDEQIATQGKATEEQAKQVNTLFDQLKSLQDAQEEERKTLRKDLDDIKANLGRPGMPGNGEPVESLGARFVKSEALAMYRKSGVHNVNMPVNESLVAMHRKTLLDTTMISPQAQRDPIVLAPVRAMTIRDLMPVNRTSNPSGQFYEETGFNTGLAASVTSITQTGGLATITMAAAHGWGSIGERVVVTISGAVQTEYNGDQIVTITSATVGTFAVDSGATSPATGTIVAYKRQTHGAAAGVSEGDPKPEARFQVALRTWNAEVIAHWLPITRQAAMDNDQLMALIENRLLYGLTFREEQQLLYGDGSSPNLQGILTHPRIQTYSWSAGPTTPVPDTVVDAIRRGMTRAQVAEYPVTGGVAHPFNWESVELAKGDDGHYLVISNIDSAGITRFFRVPFVVTPAIAAGTVLVGGFAQGGQIWDLEDGNVRVSDQHGTYFVENKLAVLAEERLAAVWHRPEAFVKVTLDAEPS